jgi:hypothetical protein
MSPASAVRSADCVGTGVLAIHPPGEVHILTQLGARALARGRRGGANVEAAPISGAAGHVVNCQNDGGAGNRTPREARHGARRCARCTAFRHFAVTPTTQSVHAVTWRARATGQIPDTRTGAAGGTVAADATHFPAPLVLTTARESLSRAGLKSHEAHGFPRWCPVSVRHGQEWPKLWRRAAPSSTAPSTGQAP